MLNHKFNALMKSLMKYIYEQHILTITYAYKHMLINTYE